MMGLKWYLQSRSVGRTRDGLVYFDKMSFRISGFRIIFSMNFLLFIRLMNFSSFKASSFVQPNDNAIFQSIEVFVNAPA